MPKRTIGFGFERLEIRDMMDAEPMTIELSPIVKGTIESTYTQWSSVRDTDSGQGVFHNETDQAGVQRHLWTGNYYGWEGMAEFATNLPTGAVIDGATLRLTVTQKLDTMNRKPSLVAHLSTQEAVGSITPGEYRNAAGAALGTIAYDAVTPGQESTIAIDPATIPANGNVSISLRTSDQIAGQEPESSHNSQSVFHYSNIRLDVRYHVPDAPTNTEAVDAVMGDIGDNVEEVINTNPSLLDAVMDSLDEESWNQLSSSLESAFELERTDAEFRENYRRNNIDVAAVSLTAIGPMLTAAQQTFTTASTQYTQAVNTFSTAEAAWTPVRQKYLAAEAQEKELYRLHLAATTKAERNRTANTLNDYRNYVFYPLRTQETTLATAMNAARTAMNNAGTAHTQAQTKLNAVTEALNDVRAFAARSHANNAELPSLPIDGEPAAPSIVAETAEGKNYAGAAKMSSWIESKPYGNVMIVRFASAGDSTTFNIPMFGATHTANHPNGTADMTVEIRLNMEAVSSRWSPTPFAVEMKDAESLKKIGENAFSVDLSAANILSRVTPINVFWEREAEVATPAIAPRIIPVLAERNHLMVSIDAAGASTQIGIEGIHNPLSQISVSHTGGALGITRTLTFTQDIPSGTYNVILSTQEHGLTLASIPVTWNATTKIVSYDERAFASLADAVAAGPLTDVLRSEFVTLGTGLRTEASEATTRTDASFSNAQVQRQTLQGLTYPTLTNIWSTAETKMMASFPDIFPTNEQAWIAARVATSNGTLTFRIVADRLHSTQADMFDRLRDGLGDMENVGLKIIDASMQAAARIYAGSSQQTEWTTFQSAYSSLLTTPAYRAEVGFLSSCGIFMPSATAFWNESWTQFHAQQDFLVHMHEEERHLVDEILPNLSRNKAITEAKNHAEEQAAADIAAGRQPKTEERYVDDYFAQIARDSRGNGNERRREVTERQIRRILGSSDGRTQAFAERIGLHDMDIAQAIVAAMDPAVLESVAQRYETEKDDVLTEAMEDFKGEIKDRVLLASTATIGGTPWVSAMSTHTLSMSPEGYHGLKTAFLSPNETGKISFTIETPMFLNIGIPNISEKARLTLKNASGEIVHQSDWRMGGAYAATALSMSANIPAGTYIIELERGEAMNQNLGFPDASSGMKAFSVSVDINQINNASIHGLVSIAGSPKVMSVSLNAAEFDNAGRRLINYGVSENAVSQLNPNLPVWVIVHGRSNSEDSSQIMELARNLRNLGVQVVTLDWHDGARDNDIPAVGLEGSKWIEKTGAWAANQLRAIGFLGESINVIGHSWGSYVSYEIGAHIPGGVKTIVALDPAADTPVLGGGRYKGFNDANFSFANVASSSYAFHSSDLSNEHFALSAEYSFDIVAPEGYEAGGIYDNRSEYLAWMYENSIEPSLADKGTDALREHSFAIDVFSGLLTRQKTDPLNPTASLFALEKLRSNDDEFLKRNGWEGVFYVDPMRFENTIGTEEGDTVWKAGVFGFVSKDKYGNDILNPRQL